MGIPKGRKRFTITTLKGIKLVKTKQQPKKSCWFEDV